MSGCRTTKSKAMAKNLTRKEADIVKACFFQPRYSGEDSEHFWSAVRHPANDRTLYDFACALQSLEHRVLAAVNHGVGIRAHKTVIAQRRRK